MLFWLILPLQLFLRNQVGKSSKKRVQAAWSPTIHHVKWWISRFRGIYRALIASDGVLFLILLKGFRSLCNVTRSSVLVAVGALYLPLHFIIIVIIIIVVIIDSTFIVNIIFIISTIIRTFIKSSLLFLWWGTLTLWFWFFLFLDLS